MNKIVFDMTNGVRSVLFFDGDEVEVEESDVLYALENDKSGKVYRAIISDALFDRISAEYGIK